MTTYLAVCVKVLRTKAVQKVIWRRAHPPFQITWLPHDEWASWSRRSESCRCSLPFSPIMLCRLVKTLVERQQSPHRRFFKRLSAGQPTNQ